MDTTLETMKSNPDEFSSVIDSGREEAFDEILSFNHPIKKLRIFELSRTKKEEMPFLLDNEFILNVNISYENEHLHMTNQETYSLLKTKTKTYLTSDDFNFKSNYFDVIFNYVNDIGFENSVNLFLPIITKIPIEVFNIKNKFLLNIHKYTSFLSKNGDEGMKIIKNHIIPVIFDLVQDKKSQKISDLACDVLIDVTKDMKEEDRGESVLSTVLTLANDDEDEESRILASKLFNNLASFIGHELCEFYIIPQVASFAHDTNSKVRKAVSGGFYTLSSNVNYDMFKAKLIPVFQKLSQDSLWTVRKALAEQLHKISKLCEEDLRQTTLIDIFKKFATDSQRYVKIVAIENFGYFIDTMQRGRINKGLIDYYIQIINEYYNPNMKKVYNPDIDMIYFCAYNFPAVLLCHGPENWNDLKGIYLNMANEREKKVKKSIASSIAEVANLLDTSIVEKDILPIFDKFYRDENEIQLTILKNMPKFLKKLQPTSRNIYLDKIIRLPNPRDKWRTRAEKSKSISKYSSVFDDEITYTHLLPICLQYCVDDIAEVKNTGARYISLIFLQLLRDDSKYKTNTLKVIDAFARSIHYNYRQLFALMCYKMGRDQTLFIEHFYPYMIQLVTDSVPNVRITLASVLKEIYNKYGWAKGSNEVKKLIYILKNDKQDDPVIALSTISLDLSANLDIDLINYNNSFDNRMTFLKDEFNIVRNLPINSTFKQKTTKITNNLKNVQPLIPELEESKIIQDSNTVNNSTLKDTNEEENANLLEKSTDTAVLDEIQIEMKPDIKADEKLDKEENNNSSNEDSVESK